MTDTDVLQSDLRDMLRALGKFDGARPESPHEVFRECIADVERLRTALRRLLDRYGMHSNSDIKFASDALGDE